MSSPEPTSDTEEAGDEEVEAPTFLGTSSLTAWLKQNELLTAISRLEEVGVTCLSDIIVHLSTFIYSTQILLTNGQV